MARPKKVLPNGEIVIKFPSKPEIAKIIKRYLKPERQDNFNPALEFSTFYALYKKYPSPVFWERHDPGFKLMSLVWFKGADGKAKLQSDWEVFHLKLDTGEETNDNSYIPDVFAVKQGEDVKIEESKPKSVAGWMK